MRTRLGVFSAIMLLAIVIPNEGYARWPDDGVRVCTHETSQHGQRMVPDGCGGAFIVFQDMRSGNYDIYAQRIDSTGALLWDPEGVVVSSRPTSDNNPRITTDGAGGIIIVWGWVSLYAQRLDADGNILWVENGVSIGSIPGTERDPKVASDETGRAIIVWSVQADGDQNIYAQKLNADGSPLWAAAGVPVCTHSSYSWYPEIVHDGAGGAIIIWQDYRSIYYRIYAQRIDSLGVVQWTTDGVPVCVQSEYQTRYVIAADGSGGAVIAWQCRPGLSGDYDLYAQRIDADGNALWTGSGVPVYAGDGNQYDASLISESPGGAIIAWADSRGGTTYDIYMQKYDEDGVAQWDAGGIPVCQSSKNQYSPEIATNGAGGAFCTWTDLRLKGKYTLFGDIIESDGNLKWGNNGYPISLFNGGQSNRVIPDGSGGGITIWGVGRVWAYRLNLNFPIQTDADDTPLPGFLVQNYPNPFNPLTTIKFDLPQAGHVKLSVYDVNGEFVLTIVDQHMSEGRNEVIWHAEDSRGLAVASGIYFYRLVAGDFVRTRKMVLLR